MGQADPAPGAPGSRQGRRGNSPAPALRGWILMGPQQWVPQGGLNRSGSASRYREELNDANFFGIPAKMIDAGERVNYNTRVFVRVRP